MAERTRMGPVVLVGLATAGLVAVAATRPWVDLGDATPPGLSGATMPGTQGGAADPTTFPLASALSLVLLACWGVLLVTRRRVRRAFAVLAAVTAVGLVAAVATAAATLPASAEDAVASTTGAAAEASWTGWFVVAALGALLAVVPAVLAVRLAPTWPEMGSRYDAPAAASERAEQVATEPDADAEPAERDLWRALDEGLDPTDRPGRDPAP